MNPIFGIDVSKWQGSGFNFDIAAREGVKFAILRGAYHLGKDTHFERFYKAAGDASIPVGVYHYSMAKTAAEGRAEAEFLISDVLNGKKFEYPIWMDVEDAAQRALGKRLLTDVVKAYCETIENAGYYVGIYSSASFFGSYLIESELTRYDKWIAQWAKKCTYSGAYGMWQFGGDTNVLRSNKIAGVVCDQNYAYRDYPSIIKSAGLNGFGAKKSVSEIAAEVIAGKWGNGADRKARLTAAGYDYAAVQREVNKML